jgi:hypothetical protein
LLTSWHLLDYLFDYHFGHLLVICWHLLGVGLGTCWPVRVLPDAALKWGCALRRERIGVLPDAALK